MSDFFLCPILKKFPIDLIKINRFFLAVSILKPLSKQFSNLVGKVDSQKKNEKKDHFEEISLTKNY